MTRVTMISIGVFSALCVLGLMLLYSNRQGSEMTPQQARERVSRFAEETIAHAAPGRTGTLEEAAGIRGSCHDRFGGVTGQTSRSYTWAITNVDQTLADELVTRTDQLWSERGIATRQRNRPAEVTAVLGSTDEDGFGYKLTVNRNEGMAWVTIQTPCLDEGSA